MTEPPSHAESGDPGADASDGWIVATSDGPGFRTDVTGGGFAFIADEPLGVGGSGAGPTPYEYMIDAVGSCTAMTARMYANRKKWPLERVIVRMRDTPPHIKDCLDCETAAVGPRRIDRIIELVGPLTDEQRARILQIADRCPVKQTLERGIQIRTVESKE